MGVATRKCMQAVLPGLLLHPRCHRGKLSLRRAPLPCTQHGQGRGRWHARPPYRAEELNLDPLPRRSAPARSEHSPTLRERGGSLHRRLACRWRCVGRRSMQLGLRHSTLEYFYSYTVHLVDLAAVRGCTLRGMCTSQTQQGTSVTSSATQQQAPGALGPIDRSADEPCCCQIVAASACTARQPAGRQAANLLACAAESMDVDRRPWIDRP
eukprot:COSAG01_NODE_6330_length_3732_cov_11.357831_2_plen_210_part_01